MREWTALAAGYTEHEFGDALLCVAGGDDHAVHVISVTEGRVLKLMKGHGGDIVALAAGSSAPTPTAPPPRPELLVSLSLDGKGGGGHKDARSFHYDAH